MRFVQLEIRMATDLDLRQMLTGLRKGQAVADAEGYAGINDYLVASAGNDTENISVTWLADFDTSRFVESSGYTIIEENSTMAQESSAPAGEPAGQAQVLQELIGVFKTKKD